MTDRFANQVPSIVGPSTHGFAITPSDSDSLAEMVRGIYVGTAGNITVTLADTNELVFINVPAGYILPVRATAVKATDTTATDLVGLV